MRLQSVICCLTFCLILTACGDDVPESTPTSEVIPSPTVMPTTFTIWLDDPMLEAGLAAVLDQFESANAGMTPVLTLQDSESFPEQVVQAIQSGAGPDLIIGDAALFEELVTTHLIYSLSGTPAEEIALVIPGQAFESGGYQDELFGVPLRADVPMLYRNTTLVPDEITRFEEFLAAAEAVGAVVQPNFQLTAGWLQTANALRPITPQGDLAITATELTAYLERLLQLRQVSTVQFGSDPAPFMAGEVGFYVGTSRQALELQRALGDNLAAQPLPLAVGLTTYPLGDVHMMMISINATDASIAAIQALVPFLFQPEMQRTFTDDTYPPIFASMATTPLLQTIVAAIQSGEYVAVGEAKFYAQRLPRYNNAVAQVLGGILTPEEAAASVFDNP